MSLDRIVRAIDRLDSLRTRSAELRALLAKQNADATVLLTTDAIAPLKLAAREWRPLVQAEVDRIDAQIAALRAVLDPVAEQLPD